MRRVYTLCCLEACSSFTNTKLTYAVTLANTAFIFFSGVCALLQAYTRREC